MTGEFHKGQYAVVTGAYWAFTLTDGALRMLVLLFLHDLGRSPLEIAGLFLFYEFFGIVTNLAGGALGARFGLRLTLLLGLLLQGGALAGLATQATALSLPLVMGLQALSGIAKDLTKMSAKSYMKFLVAAGDQGGLMRIVAWLTGSKNTLKGAGFFLGGWLLQTFGFATACWSMAAGIALAWLVSVVVLPAAAGKAKTVGKPREWFAHDRRVLWLSISRCALFAARDAWFVIALPLFLAVQWQWSHAQVGAFMAVWVMGYGVIQALAPSWLGSPKAFAEGDAKQGVRRAGALVLWTVALWVPLVALARLTDPTPPQVVLGLGGFALIFATCSALHSYLILAYASGERVSQQVGAYYAANASGRLLGTLLSGVLVHLALGPAEGLRWTLWGASLLVGIAALAGWPLHREERAQAASASPSELQQDGNLPRS